MQRSSSLAASLPSCIGTPPSATSRSLVLADIFGDAVIERARSLHADVERQVIVDLRRRRADELHVDAHLVHDGKALVVVLMRVRMSAACLAISAWVSGVEAATSGSVDCLRCGVTISATRGTAT